MTSPIPPTALDAAAPTSRSSFRHLAASIGATNRDADRLRHALLSRWAGHTGVHDLERRLRSLDQPDPDGVQDVDPRLAVWFSFADPADGRLVSDGDPVLVGLSDDLRNRLTGITRPAHD